MIPLVVALLCLTLIPNTSAKNSFVLGSRHVYVWPDIHFWLEQDEVDIDTAIVGAIENDSNLAGYNTHNWLRSQTSDDNIYIAAAGGDPQSIVFYIGEGSTLGCLHVFPWPPNLWYDQQYCITTDIGNGIEDCGFCFDSAIYSHTSEQNTTFVFLWSCEQGNTRGGFQFPSGYEYGMPLAWLHTNSLSDDGYSNSDSSGRAFIGFNGSAPKLAPNDVQFGQAGAVSSFLSHFYCDALCYGKSINRALDDAAYAVWSLPFSTCVLRTGYILAGENGNMVVYGDGDMHLSDLLPPDVAVTSVVPLKTAVGRGYPVNVSVTAANLGGWNETFEVTAYANATAFQTQSLTLTPGSSANLTFTWNTPFWLPIGNCSMSAYAWPVPDEVDTSNTLNNNCTGGMVIITIPGDLNGNFKVNYVDLGLLSASYGAPESGRPWNPNADIDNDGHIGPLDLGILLAHYGQHYP